MVNNDWAGGSEYEMVNKTGGLLAGRSGIGEGDFDELLGRVEFIFDPLQVGVDGGEDLLGVEVRLQFPMSQDASGAIQAIGVVWVLDFSSDDAVHGVAIVAGVDG